MSAARPRALMSWSTGKDSAMALHLARTQGQLDIVGLLTTVNSVHERVAMHAVRDALLSAQAETLGLPVRRVPIPSPCPNEEYERVMGLTMGRAKDEGITHVIFGDLFLEDLRAYRDTRLAEVGMTGVYPLWKRDTTALAREMVSSGLRAALTCIDPRHLDRAFAGRTFDGALLADLPSTVDPCGENGEFHTFAFAGPMFARPIDVVVGEVVERDGFVFADVRPA